MTPQNVLDFGQPFQIGEVSSRTLGISLPIDPTQVTTRWSNNSTWGQCSFLQQQDRTYKVRVNVNSTGLRPGPYQDTLIIQQARYQIPIIVVFTVSDIEIATPVFYGPQSSPAYQLAIRPSSLDLGSLDQGDKTSGTLTVENVGDLVWSIPSIYWGNRAPIWANSLYSPANATGKTFPYVVNFQVDTTHCEPGIHHETIVIDLDSQRFMVPVTLTVNKLHRPRLTTQTQQLNMGTITAGSQPTYGHLQIRNSGGKVISYGCNWDGDSTCFSKPSVDPCGNSFPKVVSFAIQPHYTVKGDYLGKLVFWAQNAMGRDELRVNVGVRVLPIGPLAILVDPAALNLQPIRVGDKAKISFMVNRNGRPISTISFNWQDAIPDWATKLVANADSPDEAFPITVSFEVQSFQPGTFNANVLINYSDEYNQYAQTIVPVTLTVAPRAKLFGIF